jgi:putative hemolysin
LTGSCTNVAETTRTPTILNVDMTSQYHDVSPQLVSHEELARRLPPRTPPWVTAGILSFTGMTELNQAYAELGGSSLPHDNPFEEALSRLRVRIAVEDAELVHVPAKGAVIVVANHPFGGVDGLALGATLLRLRSDVRIVTNSVLARITKLAPWFLDVEVFDAKRKTATNANQLRAALRHLAAGGLLVVFPAGTVSRFQPHRGGVTDGNWSSSVGLLARRSGATVVPCYFAGSNGPMFQAAGLVHPNLGAVLLPRELLARRDSRVRLRVGHSVSPSTILRFENDEILTSWLRLRTYDLDEPSKHSKPVRFECFDGSSRS